LIQARRKPSGVAYQQFVEDWDKRDHAGKVELAKAFNVTIDTMKHWRSDGDTPPAIPIMPLEDGRKTYQGISHPLSLDISKEPKTVAIINDLHVPYQDDIAMRLVEKLLVDVQPEYLLYAGDVCDLYQISDFDKDPKRIGQLQEDIKATEAVFQRHDDMLPFTKKILLAGNHEDRLRRFLWSKAPALSGLDALELPELFHLKDYNIDFVPYEQGVLINNTFLVIHGDLISAHSSYTAKAMYDKHGECGVCGHTHRGGSFYRRNRYGVYGWWENFCLCKLNPDYVTNPNWQQGFSLVHFVGRQFWMEQIPIVDNSLMYGGKVYR
jgi:predicted phosphodiesterase